VPFFAAGAQITIAVQPFGNFDTGSIAKILPFVAHEYNATNIKILPGVAMPQYAYYKPRNRYRAEQILTFLDILPVQSMKIIALTTKDISTTKGEYTDWGIFGLGDIGGKSCVVSIYRLHKETQPALFESRLRKLIIHELGHTFGLNHCFDPLCLMTNYKGTIAALDRTDFHLCTQCRALFAFSRQK
jgi:archaemetzincin